MGVITKVDESLAAKARQLHEIQGKTIATVSRELDVSQAVIYTLRSHDWKLSKYRAYYRKLKRRALRKKAALGIPVASKFPVTFYVRGFMSNRCFQVLADGTVWEARGNDYELVPTSK